MSTPYTPGPWVQSHRKKDNGMYSTEVYTPDGETICTLHWYPTPKERVFFEGQWRMRTGTYREGNAQLISAAPDLLEALQSFLRMYTSMVDSGDCGWWDPETDQEVIQARAAIAKAIGEPQTATP